MPFFLKGEYSCDSFSVRLCSSADDWQSNLSHVLKSMQPGERPFLEEAGGQEWTVAATADRGRALAMAVIEMGAMERPYIDYFSKHNNSEVFFKLPSRTDRRRLEAYTDAIISALRLSGYFRIVIVSLAGDPAAIDINLLPCLNCPPLDVSYFPLAFAMDKGWSYAETIRHVTCPTLTRWNLNLAHT